MQKEIEEANSDRSSTRNRVEEGSAVAKRRSLASIKPQTGRKAVQKSSRTTALPERVGRLLTTGVRWVVGYLGDPHEHQDDPRDHMEPVIILLPDPPTLSPGTEAEVLVSHNVPPALRERLKTTGLVHGTLQELLRDYWPFGRWILSDWMRVHADEVGDLFQHPEDYPAFVVWSALCALKFSDEQAEVIQRFLVERVIKRLSWSGRELQKRLGQATRRDVSSEEVEDTLLLTDKESELYLHFVERVLDDIYFVESNLLGYLYRAAGNYRANVYERAETRPVQEVLEIPEGEGQPDTSLDEVLSDRSIRQPHRARGRKRIWSSREVRQTGEQDPKRQEKERKQTERRKEIEGKWGLYDQSGKEGQPAETSAVIDALLSRMRLTSREREVAILLFLQVTPTEIAKRLGVSKSRVSQIINALASNPVLQQAYDDSEPTDS